jgi:outer membrane PBP1 activator LpoA protein
MLSLLLVSACSGLIENIKSVPTLFTEHNASAESLLKEADLLSEQQNTDLQLAAVEALTKEGKYVLAESVIEHLQSKVLTAEEKNNLLLLIADNEHAQDKLDSALTSVKSINVNLLTAPAKLHYLTLKSDLYVRKKQYQNAVDTLFQLTPLLTDDEQKQQYNDLLLLQLSMLPAKELSKYKTAKNKTATALTQNQLFVQGWYALGGIYQKYQLRSNLLIRSIDDWKIAYPTHPAIAFMPVQLNNLSEAVPFEPTKVAVLLPLTGRFQKPAQAIQYGISHAFYNQSDAQKQTLANTTNPEESVRSQAMLEKEFITTPPNLVFFDTNKMTMKDIADKLHQQKIDFVIGPLLKPNVEAFLPLVKDLPVLALNSFPVDRATRKEAPLSSIHYAFPLSPEGEAEQAAEIIFRDKRQKPLVFAPQSTFGKRTAAAFEARWKKLSDEQSRDGVVASPAETYYFTNNTDYKKFLGNALQIREYPVSSSSKKAKTEIKSRGDVDAIYIISSRYELTFFKSFLSVSLNPSSPQIPLYASSRSHSTDITKTQTKELEGLTFSDLTFLMDNEAPIYKKVQAVWPKQGFATLRLFALGYDSYNLISQLKPLQAIDGYHYKGLVGDITLDRNNTINSQLSWAKYQDDKLIEITSPVSSK